MSTRKGKSHSVFVTAFLRLLGGYTAAGMSATGIALFLLRCNPLSVDLDGDSGAQEDTDVVPATRCPIYVSMSGSDAHDGSTWAQAKASVTDALTAAAELVQLEGAFTSCEIWVAAGVYHPLGSRRATFQLRPAVRLYGGFRGDESDKAGRNWTQNKTALSGDIGIKGESADNVYHVVTGTADFVLDGFTITMGNADGPEADHMNGGGMFNSGASGYVANCRFELNTAAGNGGGMYNADSEIALSNSAAAGNSARAGGGLFNDGTTLIAVSSAIEDNLATSDGGGVANQGFTDFKATDCVIRSNPAETGGAAYNDTSLFRCYNTVLANNTATRFGGAVFSDETPSLLISCLVQGNTAGSAGGGLHNYNYSRVEMENCTLTGNVAEQGGAVFNRLYSLPLVTNCIFWDNAAVLGPQMFNVKDTSTTHKANIAFSDVQGGCAAIDETDCEIGNIDAPPLFVDAKALDFRLTSRSPCIDAGDDAVVFTETDLAGDPRIAGGAVDLGAYEYQRN